MVEVWGDFPPLAVIGCGGVARERHLPALERLGWRPRVLVDPRLERAAALARRYRAGRAAADVSELAPGEVAAALVATNMASHARICLPLLERGIHILVEKPMATSLADARAMAAAAAAGRVCLAVGNMRRFLFVNRWVKGLVDSGALGRVEGFDVREGESYHKHSRGRVLAERAADGAGEYSPAFWDLGTAGGGVLLETGSHTLDTLLWWLGDGRLISYRDDSLGGVESDAVIEMELAGGAKGVAEISRTRDLRNTAVITGSRGRVEVALHRNEIVDVWPTDLLGFELDGRSGADLPEESLRWDLFPRELDDWRRAMVSGGQPFVSGESAIPAIGMIDSCYRNRRPLGRKWAVGAPRAGGDDARAGGGLLSDKTALVTGASGFIGGRLAEKLALEQGAKVRAAVRTFRNAARVSRLPPERVELRMYDLAARDDGIDGLVDGCDTVFHLARDMGSVKANVDAARRLGAACGRAGVRRVVYVSSMSVYRPPPGGPLTEASPMGEPGGNDKPATQREFMRMMRDDGLPACIIQPSIVYGPYSGYWTERPADLLLGGVMVLPSPGDGICDAVYVDDVVRALVLAAERDGAVGEAFLISGPEQVTWADFYGAYARALGRDGGIRLLPYDVIARRIRRDGGGLSLERLLRYGPLRPLREALRAAVYDRLGDGGKAWAGRIYRRGGRPGRGGGDGPREFLPSQRLLDLYAARCPVQLDKARRILGYEPEFGLEAGMELTADYLRWARGLD